LSTEPFHRVLWVVLDGFGHEHAKRAIQSGTCPALAQIAREGHLGPARPARPVCQTPPALLALFTGTEPAQNGVWGYYMPDPSQPERSMSGFHADVSRAPAIWRVMEDRGLGYSLMNVAFRNDAVWRGPNQSMVLGFDGYRLWQKPALYRLGRGVQHIEYRGIRLRATASPMSVALHKGSSLQAVLRPGEGRLVTFTPGTLSFAHLVEPRTLFLNPVTPAVCRGSDAGEAARDGFLEMSAFRAVRGLNASRAAEALVPVSAEILPAQASFQRKAHLMLQQASNPSARLVVGYFSLIDEFNHAYFDLFESAWPDGRAAELFTACVRIVDDLLGSLMQGMSEDTLLVVSSDHGAMAQRSMLHLNEIFAAAGLTRKDEGGYDFRRSALWYHPSDCGQVICRDPERRAESMAALRRVIDAVNKDLSAGIGIEEGSAGAPYLAFLYPRGDMYFTGRAGRRSELMPVRKKTGGHHLSPLSPTPWIDAVLGLWSRRLGTGTRAGQAAPSENTAVKKFILQSMEIT